MRLRLRIERNLLPPVQTLWPVKDSTTTISELLQQINGVFPLEGLTWGLEDYVISLAGYELLHYHILKEVLKDEDELVIKPLQWVDLRSRTVTGRSQITGDGRHLYDGIPFGRPAIRAPTRPEVRIPPRKRRRLEESEEMMDEEQQEEPAVPLMLTEGLNGQIGEDEDSEEDEDFQVDGIELDSNPEDDSSSEDDSSDPSTSDSDLSSDASSSDSTSESEDEEPWEGFSNETTPSGMWSKQNLSTGVPSPKQKTSTQKTTPSSKEAPSAPVDVDQTRISNDETALRFVGIPSEGKAETRNRNARRRDAKKLSHLKATGVLPQHTTLADMRQLGEKEGALSHGNADADAEPQVNGADARVSAGSNHGSEVNNAFASNEVDMSEIASMASETVLHKRKGKSKNTNSSTSTSQELEQQRQQLVNAIASGGIDVDGADGDQNELDMPEQLSSRPPLKGQSKAAAMIPRSVSGAGPAGPRAKLDLASSKRLLFNSLGVRVPKTQEEKDALQKKLAGRPKRNAAQEVHTTQTNITASATSPSDVNGITSMEHASDSWRNKINLTAVECCDEDVTLSEPPFPFHQRWDPQYNRRGKKRTSSAHVEGVGKKRKRGGHQSATEETYDKYNTDSYGDALNYDEEVEDDEYWEDGALLNGDGADEDDDADSDDGFPALPSDINTLPLVTEAEASVGDFITFTELTFGADTNWTPEYKTRTAKVVGLSGGDGGDGGLCKFELAKRDVLAPSYDDEGNRVYSKFEMPQEDADQDEDARLRECKWSDLGDGKVRMVERATKA